MVPYRMVWEYWRALRSAHAHDTLNVMRGIGLALGDGETVADQRRRVFLDAYPAEA